MFLVASPKPVLRCLRFAAKGRDVPISCLLVADHGHHKGNSGTAFSNACHFSRPVTKLTRRSLIL